MTAFSLFLVPQAYTAGAKVINLDANRHGAMELYFLEHYQDDAHLVQCGQFIQDLFNEPWWSAETGFDPFSLKDGQEKWLSSALLLARGSKALLKKCRTDIGLATDKKQIKPSQWKNLDALKDYLTAFLS